MSRSVRAETRSRAKDSAACRFAGNGKSGKSGKIQLRLFKVLAFEAAAIFGFSKVKFN